MSRRLARLLALIALVQAAGVLERVAYAAGVDEGVDRLTAALVDEDLADELEPADVSDVAAGHPCPRCCGVPA